MENKEDFAEIGEFEPDEQEFNEAVKALMDIGLPEDEAIQQVEDFYNLY